MSTGRQHCRTTDSHPSRRRLGAHRFRISRVCAGVCAAIGLASLAVPTLAAQGQNGAPQKRYAEGRILVQAKPGLPSARFGKLLGQEGARSLRRMDRLGVHVIEVPKGAEEAFARRLARHPHVKAAEVDELVPLEALVPNDPQYPSAWHLAKIQAPGAWDVANGTGVTVAVLDTWVDPTHLDLAANLVPGWNAVAGTTTTETTDVYGHGTKVAGTVAALSNNALGVTSVAWGAKVMPVRITNRTDGNAYTSDIANGLVWAADHGAKVANVSYGVTGSSIVASAAQYLRSKGGIVVVAAGNSSTDPGYANSPYMVTVSATDGNDAKASWSNYGNLVDFAAPGVGIWSTVAGGSYAAVSGTSFASPTTAAVAALVMAANPDLLPADVEAVLQNSADDLGAAGWDANYGFGRVNAARAVNLAGKTVVSDTQAPTVGIGSPAAGATVQDVATVDVTASDNYGVARVELYANGALVASDTTAPYAFAWDTSALTAGSSVTLTARAYDAANNAATSTGVTVKIAGAADTTPPTVAVTSPANGATVSGTVSLSASGSDNVKLSSVSLYFDGRLVCSAAANPSCSVNTRYIRRGNHTVSAKAKDAAGNQSSTSITVKR